MKGIGEGGDWPANGRKPPTSRGADIQSTVGVFCTVSKNKNKNLMQPIKNYL